MDRVLTDERDMSNEPNSNGTRRIDRRLELGRGEGDFALAHMLAVVTAFATAVLLRYAPTVEGLGTPAALCLGATVGLILLGRRDLRVGLTKEAEQRGLSPEETREYVERHLA